MNRARRDLCGGRPVTGVPTATQIEAELDFSTVASHRKWQPAILRETRAASPFKQLGPDLELPLPLL